jgi:hypothetical protein
MVGLTRFFLLMNLGEKNRVSSNVYMAFSLFRKSAFFRGVEKLFVLQTFGDQSSGRSRNLERIRTDEIGSVS